MIENYLKTPIAQILDKSLRPADKIIWQYLSWRQGNNGQCWPSLRTIATDLNVNLKTVKRSIDRLNRAGKIQIQKEDKPARGKGNKYSVTVPKKGTDNNENSENCTQKGYTTVPKKGTVTVPKKGTKKNTVKINHKNTPSGGFAPPTIEEVRQYALSIEYVSLDAEHFVDYYAARGWRLPSGQRMRDWRATVRTWRRRDMKGQGNGTIKNDSRKLEYESDGIGEVVKIG